MTSTQKTIMVKPQVVVKRPIVEVIGGYHAAADTLAHQDYILDQDEINSGNPSKKRRRLTYLSPEERLLRRKLKNRVAAQIARDKKKAKMSELEEMIAKLEEQNRKLQSENYNLKKEVKAANEEKEQLKCQMGGTITRRCKDEITESAELIFPLPKERSLPLLQLIAHLFTTIMTVNLICCSSSLIKSKSFQMKMSEQERQLSWITNTARLDLNLQFQLLKSKT